MVNLQSKRLVLLYLLIISFSMIHGTSPGAEDYEDDDDIIKHFEKLLKGKGTSSNDDPKSNPSDQQTVDRVTPEKQETPYVPEEQASGYPPNNPQIPNEQPACQCKKYFECNVAGDRIINGGGGNPDNDHPAELEVDVRLGDTLPSTCGHYLDICCDSVRENTTDIRNPEYQHTACGKRNLEGVGFRVKGAVNQESQFGEFPWMAAIVSPERQDGRPQTNVFVCGGSLIHPSVVLTAAHCVQKRNSQDLIVRLGEWDTQTSEEIYPHKDHFVTKVVIHEDFYPGALYNDVALLFLKDETKIAPHIDTICLPPANFNFDGQRCYASGWGRDSFGQEGKYQVILKKLDLPIVPRDACENGLRGTRLGRRFRLHESFVCAGGEKGRDTCRGDGGSPLVCNVPGTDSYVQYGIVAWGVGCGEEGVPGVYVNVPKFVGWITKRMSEARLDTNYFKIGRKLF